MARPLTPEQHRLLSDRIRANEARTTGEIYCVVARRSDGYFFPAAFMLTLGAVLASIVVSVWLDRQWTDIPHLAMALSLAAAVAAVLAVLWLAPGMRIHLVHRRLRYRRAHDNAIRQFFAHNVHVTEKRTGVLLFVSLDERYAEVVADAGIDAHVDQSEWNGIIADLTASAATGRLAEGLVVSIDRAGALLATHYPGAKGNPNELDDHVVEL